MKNTTQAYTQDDLVSYADKHGLNSDPEIFRVVGTVLNPTDQEKSDHGFGADQSAEIIITGTFKLTPEAKDLGFRDGVYLDPNGNFLLHNFRADTVEELKKRYDEIANQFEAA